MKYTEYYYVFFTGVVLLLLCLDIENQSSIAKSSNQEADEFWVGIDIKNNFLPIFRVRPEIKSLNIQIIFGIYERIFKWLKNFKLYLRKTSKMHHNSKNSKIQKFEILLKRAASTSFENFVSNGFRKCVCARMILCIIEKIYIKINKDLIIIST